MPIYQLSARNVRFPDPLSVDDNPDYPGLIAMGGDLTVSRLIEAYRNGIFPWTVNPITWWSPDPRAVFDLEHFHVPRSLARVIRKQVFQITVDQAFFEVMEACAEPSEKRKDTWITSEFIDAYTELHKNGIAHSVECWHEGILAGGVYGVAIGALFAGESMFHRVGDASKVALFHLVERLKQRRYTLFDIQMITPVTARLGARVIERHRYIPMVREAVSVQRQFVD